MESRTATGRREILAFGARSDAAQAQHQDRAETRSAHSTHNKTASPQDETHETTIPLPRCRIKACGGRRNGWLLLPMPTGSASERGPAVVRHVDTRACGVRGRGLVGSGPDGRTAVPPAAAIWRHRLWLCAVNCEGRRWSCRRSVPVATTARVRRVASGARYEPRRGLA